MYMYLYIVIYMICIDFTVLYGCNVVASFNVHEVVTVISLETTIAC